MRTATIVTAFCLTGAGQTGAAVQDTHENHIHEHDTHEQVGSEAPQVATAIIGGTEAQHAMAEWALARFDEADLPLPSMTIEFHTDKADCNGYLGYYSRSDKQLDVCNQGSPRTEPIHTILHELAHAWSFEYLPKDIVEAFTEDRGLDAWHDADARWWQQGQEQAAEVVAWGLMDEAEPFNSIWVIGEECERLSEAFAYLTGVDPLHASSHSCQ
jgi:heat shock protein HslJ